MVKSHKKETVTKTVILKQQKAKSKSRSKNNGKKKSPKGLPFMSPSSNPLAFGRAIIDPFCSPPVRMPDDVSEVTGIVKTQFRFTAFPTANSGTSSTHNLLITFDPNLYTGYINSNEVSAGGGTFSTGPSAPPTTYPNAAAALGLVSASDFCCTKMRPLSFGVRVTPLVQELNRAGKISFLQHTLAQEDNAAVVNPAFLGPAGSAPTVTSATAKARARYASSGRVSDMTVSAHFVPTLYSDFITPEPNASAVPVAYGWLVNSSKNSTFSILVENDVTSTATAVGNGYDIEYIMHSEVVPFDPARVTYDVEPSLCDFAALSFGKNIATTLSNSSYRPSIGFGRSAEESTDYFNIISNIASSTGDFVSEAANGFASSLGFRGPGQLAGAAAAAYMRSQYGGSNRRIRN